MKLKTKIQLIFATTVLVAVTIIGVLGQNSTNQVLRDNVKNNMLISANLAASQISEDMEHYKSMVSVTSKDATILQDYRYTNMSSESARVLKERENAEKISKISELAKEYGFVSGNILDSRGVSIDDGTDFSDREYVKLALDGIINISDINLSKYTNTYGFSVAAPLVANDGKVKGVVYYRIDVDFMKKVTDNAKISKNGYAYIIDDTGNIIVHKDDKLINNMNVSDEGNVVSKYAREAMDGKNGYGEYEENGKLMVVGYSPIENTNGWSIIIVSPESDFTEQLEESQVIRSIVEIIILICALLIAILFARYISGSVSKVKDLLVNISKGELNNKIETTKRKDEIGVLQNAAVELQKTLESIMGEANHILQGMSEYNLKQKNMNAYPGEFNILSVSVNRIKNILRNLIKEVQDTSANVGSGASELADASDSLAQGTVAQSSSIQFIVEDMDDMTDRINRNAENEALVDGKLKGLDTQIKNSDVKMTELLEIIRNIENMSEDIQKIVGTIDSIAFQTNILALNASVEAARAGENGRGFAVVAEEVGALATKSSEASKQTAELIEKCIMGISMALGCANETFDYLNEIVGNSEEISTAFEQIAIDTKEQVERTERIKEEIVKISDVIHTNTSTTEETASTSSVLSEQANSLSAMIRKFKV